ncbi:CD14 antigen [Sigmodon hispidus]
MERVLGSLLLLLTLVHASPTTPEPCELDEDSVRCVCNFSDPQPNWSSAFLCAGAVDVEFYGGDRSLEHFLKRVDTEADLGHLADVVKSLPWQRLKVADARVPAAMLFGVLRMLGYSSLKELTLENLDVTGTTLPPPLEALGPNLNTLSLSNVSWATGDAWLAELQQWLKPGLQVLRIAQAHSLNFSCEQVRVFPALATLDLSDNPELGERGLISALCPSKFPALQVLALRNAGMETPSGVCSALAAASVQLEELDLSHNSLRYTADAPGCDWPSKLNSLNLSFNELEQVPKGLPAKLRVLDLSYNKLDRKPRPDELPESPPQCVRSWL